MDTLKGSLLENFFPKGWDLKKIDDCCNQPPEEIGVRQKFWNKDFNIVECADVPDFNVMMGHEIALEITKARDEGRKLILILPVGPMGMYRWTVYFLKQWNVSCGHVYGFNMDEWSDGEGNTLDPSNPYAFKAAMGDALYGPLGALTVPEAQRNFATKANLPLYPEKIAALRAQGAKMATVFGIGRVFHIAFWEPHLAAEFSSVDEWKKQMFRLGVQLHPLTIEQNALSSFKGRTTLIPCRANSIGPGIFLQSDTIIGGCDGTFGRGMQWQGVSLWVTLRYGPDMWIPASFMPQLPGKIFYLKELTGPLVSEVN
jgi:glucosamine-6-phosphate deaminase